jgi:hypothetical protein
LLIYLSATATSLLANGLEGTHRHIDLVLPPRYVVDELPEPVSLDTDLASYHSAATAEATALQPTSEYTVKPLQLDASH